MKIVSRMILFFMVTITVFRAAAEPFPTKKFAATRLCEETFFSEALAKEQPYTVLLPEEYQREKSYPVVYFLHGRGRSHRSLVDDKETLAKLSKMPFIVVFPQGDDGFYIDSPVNEKHLYRKCLDETIADAEKKYAISSDRKLRGIAGWSMGGYGALCFAESEPDQFSALATIIALSDYPKDPADFPERQKYDVVVSVFGNDHEDWMHSNPIYSVGALKQFDILMVCGRNAFDYTMNRNFIAALQKEDVTPAVVELAGGHQFSVVSEALDSVLPFFQTHFERK